MFEKIRRRIRDYEESPLPQVDDGPGPGSSKKEDTQYVVNIVVALNTQGSSFKWQGSAYISRVVDGKASHAEVIHKYGHTAESVSLGLEHEARNWVQDQRKVQGGNLNKTFTL